MTGLRYFLHDLAEGLANYRIWLTFGWLDIKLRYRRTYLGPFWMTLSFAVSAAAMGFVYSTLFQVSIKEYLPYLMAGLAIWILISTLLNEGCSTFISSAQIILENRLALSLHAFRLLVRNMLAFAHNLIVVVLIAVVFGVQFDASVVLALPALVLIVLNGYWAALLFGIVCTRFRDFPQVVTLLITITFFITPIFWHRDLLTTRGYIADFNPLYHFVDILRAPLIGQLPATLSWYVVIGCTLAGWALTVWVGAKYLKRVSYWL